MFCAYSKRQFAQSDFDATGYVFPTDEGVFKAVLDCKRYGKTRSLIGYFALENGQTIMTSAWQNVNDGLMAVLAKFAACMKDGHTSDSDEAQALAKELQNYITENYYTCTNEMLAGLGQMYVADERFKNNIDKHTPGTAAFISESIATYCKK